MTDSRLVPRTVEQLEELRREYRALSLVFRQAVTWDVERARLEMMDTVLDQVLATARAGLEAVAKIEAEVIRQMKRGEVYEYFTSSEPVGVRGGVYTSRRGDLCDVRDAVEQIIRDAGISTQRSGSSHDSKETER